VPPLVDAVVRVLAIGAAILWYTLFELVSRVPRPLDE
jgi:hypothetical protein